MGSFWSHSRLKPLWNTLLTIDLNSICPFKGHGYPFFASQKSIKLGFSARSLAQTFALIYEGAGLEGVSSHSEQRHYNSYFENASWSPQHQHYRYLPLHKSKSVEDCCRVSLINVSNCAGISE